MSVDDPRSIAARFLPGAGPLDCESYPRGHINRTYLVTDRSDRARYLLQRINERVFPDPVAVVENVATVTRHLRYSRGAGERGLELVPPLPGTRYWIRDEQGGIWRMSRFVENTETHTRPAGPEQTAEAGRIVAEFHAALASLPCGAVTIVLTHFHDPPWRHRELLEAVALDPVGRAVGIATELELVARYNALREALTAPLASGLVPRRLVHNDTKLDNILFDRTTSRAVCLIDLDTVMPGTVLFDLGDMLRAMTASGEEDDPEPSRQQIDLCLYEALVRGYFGAARNFLGPAEAELTVTAGLVLTYQLALRFLTDHLLGDRYFRVLRPGQNLDRARAQLALLASMHRERSKLEDMVHRLWLKG